MHHFCYSVFPLSVCVLLSCSLSLLWNSFFFVFVCLSRSFQSANLGGHGRRRLAQVDQWARLRARRAVGPGRLLERRRAAGAGPQHFPERKSGSGRSSEEEGELVDVRRREGRQLDRLAMSRCQPFGNGVEQWNCSQCFV